MKKKKTQLYQTGNLNFGTTVQNPAFGISRGIGVYGLETGLLHRNGGNNPKQWDTEIYPGPSFTWKPDRHRLEWPERRDPTAFGVTGGNPKKMLRGYERLAFIDARKDVIEKLSIRSQDIAQRIELQYEEVRGDNSLVKTARRA